jgi:ribonuclease D
MTEETQEAPALPAAAPQAPIVVVDTRSAFHHALDDLLAASGPLALDAERASGFRYSARAYLVQVHRTGSANYLIDPLAIGSLADITTTLGDQEWIIHAAHQDLACLREVGVEPQTLFDTELGARLAGLPKVGLQGVVEDVLGMALAKEHSAADWSTRPLPDEWLAYAALDVELLPRIRDEIARILTDSGKWESSRPAGSTGMAISGTDASTRVPSVSPWSPGTVSRRWGSQSRRAS